MISRGKTYMENKIKWKMYPQNRGITNSLFLVISEFERVFDDINSSVYDYGSIEVASFVSSIHKYGYISNSIQAKKREIFVPIAYGENGNLVELMYLDFFNEDSKTAIKIEAGRGYQNNQFLRDIVDADLTGKIETMIIAIRLFYRSQRDYSKVITYLGSVDKLKNR